MNRSNVVIKTIDRHVTDSQLYTLPAGMEDDDSALLLSKH